MRAVRSYLMQEVITKKLTSTVDHLVVTPEEEAADYAACIRANDKWNAAIAEEREKRLESLAAERREYILTRLELKEERDRIAFETAEKTVRREKVHFRINLFCPHRKIDVLFSFGRNVLKRIY